MQIIFPNLPVKNIQILLLQMGKIITQRNTEQTLNFTEYQISGILSYSPWFSEASLCNSV